MVRESLFALSLVLSCMAAAEVRQSLAYGPRASGSDAQTYDLYLPAAADGLSGDAPFFLFLHGGAWCAGSKGDGAAILREMAGDGFACASMDYALSSIGGGGATFDDMLRDIDAMVSHLAGEFRRAGASAPPRIAIGGMSAGGHLAMLYAYDEANPDVLGLGLRHELGIACVFSDCGPSDLASREFAIAGKAGMKCRGGEMRRWFEYLVGIKPGESTPGSLRMGLAKYSPVGLICEKSPPTVAVYCETGRAPGSDVGTDGIVAAQNFHALTNRLAACRVQTSAFFERRPHCSALPADGRLRKAVFAAVRRRLGPGTYCNPMPLPGIPISRNVRDPEPADLGRPQYRELADPTLLVEGSTIYCYPSDDMAWKSVDGGATWKKIDIVVRYAGHRGIHGLCGMTPCMRRNDSRIGGKK